MTLQSKAKMMQLNQHYDLCASAHRERHLYKAGTQVAKQRPQPRLSVLPSMLMMMRKAVVLERRQCRKCWTLSHHPRDANTWEARWDHTEEHKQVFWGFWGLRCAYQ